LVWTTPKRLPSMAFLGLPVGLPVQRSFGLTVSRSERNLDFDQFIPLLIGAITLRDGEKFTEPPPRILGGGVIHTHIMTHTAAIVQQA